MNVRHDFLRLNKSMTRPVIGVELGANTLYLVSSPFEFSCDESCSDSVHSVVQIPAFRHSLLPESHVQIHGLVHTKLCESVELCQHSLRRFLSLRIVNKTVQQVSNVFVTVDVLILKSRYRNSSHRHAPSVHLRVFTPRMLCLWMHVQSRKFGCSLGQCSRFELSFQSHRRQHNRRNHNKNILFHHCLRLTSGIGLSASMNIRVLRDSTRSLC